jgi:hypothetical protein
MAGEATKVSQDQVESLIDELIGDIFSQSGTYSEASMSSNPTSASLLESAFGSAQGMSRTSVLERLFLAESFASELAEALAPALAEQIAPRLIKALEQYIAEESAGNKKPTQARRSGSTRKAESKLRA